MRILVINSGSSSLKFDLISVPGSGGSPSARRLAHGQIKHIGPEREGELEASAPEGRAVSRTVPVPGRKEAFGLALAALSEVLGGGDALHVQAVGHRVVHGADRFVLPTLVDDTVLEALEGLNSLAPLHNPAALEGIRAAREVLGVSVPAVAVFDTAFHVTLPDYAYTYALPYRLAERSRVRRYGFHGTAHEYMLQQYCREAGVPKEEATIITLQLGSGCSAAAIKNGHSVDTSMGFTPLEGLVMGTRSGDLDPGVLGHLAQTESASANEIVHMLNEQSGLLGLSGRTANMRDLLDMAGEDRRARLAIDIFCYRARKYIGAYMAALGGADAVVFGGGIGENAPTIRAQICEGLEWCGLSLDSGRNASAVGASGKISPDKARVAAYVVAVDENLLIAARTAERVAAGPGGPLSE